MKIANLADWIQIAATLGVIVGLFAVMVEIRQTKELAFSESISQSYAEEFENLRVVLGDSTAASLTRACFEPNSLTDEDLVILDSYYSALLLRGQRTAVVENVSDFGLDVLPRLFEALGKVGVSEPGRAWLRARSRTWSRNVEILEQYFEENPVPECNSFFPDFKNELRI